MLKKSLAVLLSACTLASSGACAVASAEETTKISYYCWAVGTEQEFDKAVAAKFEETHPGTEVEITFVPYSEYLSKLNTLAAADSMPEVFKMIEGNVLEWGTKGALLDLKPLYDKIGVDPNEELVSGAVLQSGDNLYGVGNCTACYVLYYNKELLEENGIEPPSQDANDPWTWDEFVEAAKKCTKDLNGNSPDDEGFDPNSVAVYGTVMPSGGYEYIPLARSNGSGIASEDGTELLLSKPEGIEVLQSIADLSLVDQCAPTVAMAQGAFSDVTTMMMNNQLAMCVGGTWSLAEFANEGYDVGVAQVPAFKEPANMSWAAGICMSPSAAENEAAFEFLRFYTDFNIQIEVAKETGIPLGGMPTRKDVFDDGENEAAWISTYTKVDETANCQAIKSILLHENTKVGQNITLKNWSALVDSQINPALDVIWLGESTAEEVFAAQDFSSLLEGNW